MNCNQKAIKLQKNISLNKLKNSTINFLETIVSKNTLSDTIITNIGNYRNRIYTPMQTLSMFISQALSQDSSCQSVVNNMALKRKKSTSVSTSAYCKARRRLPTSLLSTLTKDIAINNEQKIDSKWKFRGRNIYLIDGTTITMPDSLSNQKEYPHTKTQKEGLGFPVCRVVAIVSLTTGSIVDANIGKYSGKGTGEQALFRAMLHNFKKGDPS